MQFLVKVIISALIVALVAQIAKRHAFLGAIIASWPIISILTLIWIYVDTRNIAMITNLSKDLFWLTIPGLLFFVCLPILLRYGVHFIWATLLSLMMTAGFYWLFMTIKIKLFH